MNVSTILERCVALTRERAWPPLALLAYIGTYFGKVIPDGDHAHAFRLVRANTHTESLVGWYAQRQSTLDPEALRQAVETLFRDALFGARCEGV